MSLPDTLFAPPFAMMATPLFTSGAVFGGPMDPPAPPGVVRG